MTTTELIERLMKMPPDAEVVTVVNGGCTSLVDVRAFTYYSRTFGNELMVLIENGTYPAKNILKGMAIPKDFEDKRPPFGVKEG